MAGEGWEQQLDMDWEDAFTRSQEEHECSQECRIYGCDWEV